MSDIGGATRDSRTIMHTAKAVAGQIRLRHYDRGC